MVRLATFLLPALSLFSATNAGAVLDLLPTNFDDVVLKSGKPALVEFFAPWCGHCKTLAPVYEELATHFSSAGDKVSIAKVDADEHKSLGKRFGVQGFPTLKWFDGVSDTPTDYTGGRDLDSLTKWVTEKSGVKPKVKKGPTSAVEMLNDKTFKEQIGSDKDVLVAFTAPWCGHCKTLAPIWESLAQDFVSEPGVVIAKVDAEAENSKATSNDQGVKSYPTIKFFPKGSITAQAYEGGRSEADLVAFINSNAKTHRLIGGGLDTSAGTIDVLDTLVAKLTNGNIAYVSEEVSKAATGLKDTYATYYIKVLAKMGLNGSGYVEKETGRLERLLKKGGLAPQKVDELTSKVNILKKFVMGEASVEDVKQEL